MAEFAKHIILTPIEDEMRQSYLDYAMSVIISRALPDVRDGLKPVHRRIMHTMNELNLAPNKPFRKSAKTVGDVIGKYHPHGDVAVYDAMVRMAQDFNLRYPLVDGHGNFGSVDGDPPAAMRYTESRLHPMAVLLLEDIDRDTVDFRPNYDNSEQEPDVLPARIPNLLVNGSAGIAVGMATNIPPHNLSEVIDGLCLMIDDPKIEIADLMKVIKGPDFPTGGFIMGAEGIKDAFTTGRGSIVMRAKTTIDEIKNNKMAILVTEIPYQVNKARLIEQIADLVRDKKISGISDLRDESDRKGMRIFIELSSHAVPQVVLNQLYKHTNLQTTFGVNMLAIVDGVPRLLTLKDALFHYIDHRKVVVTRRAKYDLRKAEERRHILEGLKIALDNLDAVIKTIRASDSPEAARQALVAKFKLTEIQAQAILDMRLQRLTGLERKKIQDEYDEVTKVIASLKDLLSSDKKIMKVIKDELLEVKKKHGDDRRTKITRAESAELTVEDLIQEQDMVVTITKSGYIKRTPASAYRTQKRGGRGVMGLTMKDEDFLEHFYTTTTHQYLMFFTSRARSYRLKVHELPEASRQAKGTAIVNLLPLEQGEKVTAVIPVKDFSAPLFLTLCTKNGIIKRTPLEDYANLRKSGVYALVLREGDELVDVLLTPGNQDILLITRKGMSIRFEETQVRPMGRVASGVKGISLGKGDEVVSMGHLDEGEDLLVATRKGFGKRTPLKEYRRQNRGGKGIKTLKITAKNGEIVKAVVVNPDDLLTIATTSGTVIRQAVKDASRVGRSTQGVILIRLDAGDEVATIAVARQAEEDGEE